VTDGISPPSASTTTSGPHGPPLTGQDSGATSPPSKRTPTSLVGPVPCGVCGAYLYWYSDHIWRQFHGDGPHACGGYYARHRAEHPEDYLPLHVLEGRIPANKPYVKPINGGLRRGARRW
jgi:hypothetical protein